MSWMSDFSFANSINNDDVFIVENAGVTKYTTFSVLTSELASNSFLTPANNLSELTDTSIARNNLGLGSAATADNSTFLQTANNFSDLANVSVARANLGVTIGSDVQAWSAVLDGTTASFTLADETKLDGIATGATANSSDTTLLSRANHTGTQLLSTISDAGEFAALNLSDSFTVSGNLTMSGVLDVTNINATGTSGAVLRTSSGVNCLSWGSGGSANLTLGGNMSGASSHKLVNMADPTSAQDYVTKNYVDTNFESADATILKSADIGVSVQAYDATILKSADIGVSVQAYDATILNSADIGVSVQAYDATTVKSDEATLFSQQVNAPQQTLIDGATIDWNMNNGNKAIVTLGGNRTLNEPTNPVTGGIYVLSVVQDGTGSRAMTWPSSFDWGDAGEVTLSTTAGYYDIITLIYNGTKYAATYATGFGA